MPWIARIFKGHKVWALCDSSGNLLQSSNGLVDICYKPMGTVYRTKPDRLLPIEPQTFLDESSLKSLENKTELNLALPFLVEQKAGVQDALVVSSLIENSNKNESEGSDLVHVYVDGACLGNPGPMGVGIVCLPSAMGTVPGREISLYLGHGTNNIAELSAILVALDFLHPYRTLCRMIIYTDSSYAIGVLEKNYKIKANKELVEKLRITRSEFPKLSFVKVLGHSGVVENERCDVLAKKGASLGAA